MILPALSNDITVTINKFCSAGRRWKICRAYWRKSVQEQRCKNKTQAFSGGNVMKPVAALLVTLASLTLGAQCALAQAAKSQVERLYVIDCGTSSRGVGVLVAESVIRVR